MTRQNSNALQNIHQLITMNYGENYWFNGAAKYVMECLGEPDYDYWFFSGLTGDSLAQVYTYDRFRGDGATDYRVSDAKGGHFIESIFARCGYESTWVTQRELRADPERYLHLLRATIDKGVPVIRYFYTWGVIVGYEADGQTLLYLTEEKPEPERIAFENLFTPPERFAANEDAWSASLGFGWCFVGEKKERPNLSSLYREVIFGIPRLLTVKTEGYCFGAEAFRAWADAIENGRFEGMEEVDFDDWAMHKIYVCNVATNGSCRTFLERALQLNSDLTFLEEIIREYRQLAFLWHSRDGKDRIEDASLESLGGGFNATLQSLAEPQSRIAIAAKIRECAACMDRVLAILDTATRNKRE